MAGRPDFSTPGSQGSGQKIAVSQRPEINAVDNSQSGSVASGTTESVEFYAPAGAIWNFRAADLRVSAPSGTSSGNHYMEVSSIGGTLLLRGISTRTSDINFAGTAFKTADSDQSPGTQDAQTLALHSATATENSPVTYTYYNGTDVAQNNGRTYKAVVEEESY